MTRSRSRSDSVGGATKESVSAPVPATDRPAYWRPEPGSASMKAPSRAATPGKSAGSRRSTSAGRARAIRCPGRRSAGPDGCTRYDQIWYQEPAVGSGALPAKVTTIDMTCLPA
ncbi:hypothetical protein ACIQKB_33430 [Streptomyces sp. NPDC092046]|uniref:hypothetical protein n=1 Tax=Streptomyces sp. NPDC092046 TaxID=3366009 RepID=UPI0038232ABA